MACQHLPRPRGLTTMVMKFLHLGLIGLWEQCYRGYFYILKEGCQVIQPETPQNLHSVNLRSQLDNHNFTYLGVWAIDCLPSTEPFPTASRNFYSLAVTVVRSLH